MYQLVMMVHVLAAVFIVLLVLVQQGKGATVGASFGSGASQTLFGSRGSGSFLFRLTLAFGILFFITSIALNHMLTVTVKQARNDPFPFAAVEHQNNAKTEVANPAAGIPTVPSQPAKNSASVPSKQ